MGGGKRETQRVPSAFDLFFQPDEFFSNRNRRPRIDKLTTKDFVLLPPPLKSILKRKEPKNNTKQCDGSCLSHDNGGDFPKIAARIAIANAKPSCKLAEPCTKKKFIDLKKPFVEVLSKMTNASSDGWASDEDGMICLMRTRGDSWTEIAGTLNRGKHETHQRFKDLSSMAEAGGLSTAILANLYEEDIKRYEKYASLKHSSESSAKHGTTSKCKEEKTCSDNANANANAGSGGQDTTNKKGKGKQRVVITIPNDSSSSSSSSSSPSSNAIAPPSRSNSNGSNNERTYDYVDVLCSMYPDHKKLSPDRFYSERDVRALAALEARYRTDKWLYIAAKFANITGRMVDAELLKYKFGAEDEDAEE
ncbi:hypothetical protein M434DRAFT_36160 [Hypoxylon sp. CO27-5]|nr:hypothetical protein M434DRAFT_36160 [Hypoxylon sp. CO27-5]